MAGGTPFEFSTIGICDGIIMGHEGMKYSLSSRELVADSVESMGMGYPSTGSFSFQTATRSSLEC